MRDHCKVDPGPLRSLSANCRLWCRAPLRVEQNAVKRESVSWAPMPGPLEVWMGEAPMTNCSASLMCYRRSLKRPASITHVPFQTGYSPKLLRLGRKPSAHSKGPWNLKRVRPLGPLERLLLNAFICWLPLAGCQRQFPLVSPCPGHNLSLVVALCPRRQPASAPRQRLVTRIEL